MRRLKEAADIDAIILDADLPYPTIRLASGDTVRLDQSAYTQYRTSPDRAVRRQVFKEFWTAFQGYRRTLGTTLFAIPVLPWQCQSTRSATITRR